MHREHHARSGRGRLSKREHGELQEIRRRTLDGRVHGDALGGQPLGAVLAANVRHDAASAEERPDRAPGSRRLEDAGHEAAHALVLSEVRCNEGGRFGSRDPEALREPAFPLPVDDSEVHRLGAPPHLGSHSLRRDAEDLDRRSRMDVLTGSERIHQHRIHRQMREHPKLDLRVVCADQLVAGGSDECRADLAAQLRADRYVLQVRIGRRETPRRRDGLLPARMDALGLWVHEHRQGIDVGPLQLRQLADLENDLGQRVQLRQGLQGVGVGRARGLRASHMLQAELVEEQRLQLSRRVHVEHPPCDPMRLLLEREKLLLHAAAQGAELLGVDEHARALHPSQHLGEWQLDAFHHVRELLLRQLAGEPLPELPSGVGAGAHERGRILDEHLVEAGVAPTGFWQEGARWADRDPELPQREPDQVVLSLGVDQIAREHRVEGHPAQLEARSGQGHADVLRVVARLRNALVGEKRSQHATDGGEVELRRHPHVAMADGQVEGPLRAREAEAHDGAAHRARRAGLGHDREASAGQKLGSRSLQRFDVQNGLRHDLG